MAPFRKGQRTSSTSTSSKSNNQMPTTSTKMHAMITQRQKQALMDNLQLEITERARKLRAQYALQAQSLHTRIELRVNRIPTSLRKVTMGELLVKHAAPAKSEPQRVTASAPVPSKSHSKPLPSKMHRLVNAAAPAPRGVKRTSDAMEDDKENTPDLNQRVENPKKRTKAGEGRRVPNPATVLSPKSSNSRNIPQSSVHNQLGSPQKPTTSRPASPLKPASPIKLVATTTSTTTEKSIRTTTKAATTARTKAASKTVAAAEVKSYTGRTKRGLAVAGDRAVSSASSNTSGVSAGTTIVKKVGRALGATGTTTATAAKKAARSAKATGTVKKTAAAAAVKTSTAATTGTSTTGRRTLRKRA